MEKSESGAPIYRYNENKKNEFKPATGKSSFEQISAHVEKLIGPIEMVFHEIVSEQVHIDVLWVKPSEKRPFHTLITAGMSDKPMNTPEGVKNAEFAELSICLPEDWSISDDAFKNENNYWPIRWLKFLARFPHEYNSWLSWGHTLPNGDPATPFSENTKMNTILLLPSIVLGEEFHQLNLDNKIINFYSLIPLYSEEVELKMKNGVEALFDGFEKNEVNDILDEKRLNTIRPKKKFELY